MKNELLRIRNLTIRDPAGTDLEHFFFQVYEGEVLGILGLHCSGKSLLPEVLTGQRKAAEGEIIFRGRIFSAAEWTGSDQIYCIHQRPTLVQYRTVMENLFVIKNHKNHRLFIPWKIMRRETRKLFREFHMDIDPEQRVLDLSDREYRMVELLKAYLSEAPLIIINGIDLKYGAQDFQALFETMKYMKGHGRTFMINAYQMEQLQHFADRCMFIVNGQLLKTVENTHRHQIDEKKVLLGSTARESLKKTSEVKDAVKNVCFEKERVLVEVSHFQVAPGAEIHFEVGYGEICILLDPYLQMYSENVGASLHEQLERAEVLLEGREYHKNDRDKIRVNDFVNDQMVFSNLTLAENLLFSNCDLRALFSFVRHAQLHFIEEIFREENENDTLSFTMDNLSYAERMAIYLERTRLAKWKLLFCTGMDQAVAIDTQPLVEKKLREMTENGRSVILYTTSFEKFIGFADYILLFVDGRIQKFTAGELLDYFQGSPVYNA